MKNNTSQKMYSCPMHPEVHQEKPGRCPKCGMQLVLEGESFVGDGTTETTTWKSYMPLLVIIGLILLTSLTIGFKDYLYGNFVLTKTISYFMSGFFLVFSGFKLLDLPGFAQGYATYDILAKKVFSYGYVYPFIELFFGLIMIINFQNNLILLAEVFVMVFSGAGVLIKLAKKEKFQCACLGTFLKVPLTKITLVEDFGMAFLAIALLLAQ